MLRCFSAVARAGNLAEAADQLSRTQSALSMTLKQFELEVGHKLFESDRKNRLTPLGEQVFEIAQEQLRAFDNTANAIQTAASFPRGLIRIASIPSVSSMIFPSAIDMLTRNHLGLKVELQDTDSQSVIDRLIQGQADLGVVSGHHSLNGIKSKLLFEDEFGLVCSSQHPLATQSSTPTMSDLISAGLVGNNLCRMIGSEAFQLALKQVNVSVSNTLSLIGMVRTQSWVTVLPQQVIQIMPSELTFRKIKGIDDKRPVTLLIKERSSNVQYAEELAHIVRSKPNSLAK